MSLLTLGVVWIFSALSSTTVHEHVFAFHIRLLDDNLHLFHYFFQFYCFGSTETMIILIPGDWKWIFRVFYPVNLIHESAFFSHTRSLDVGSHSCFNCPFQVSLLRFRTLEILRMLQSPLASVHFFLIFVYLMVFYTFFKFYFLRFRYRVKHCKLNT